MSTESVLVAGVGPGLGIAVAARFAREGYRVAMRAAALDSQPWQRKHRTI